MLRVTDEVILASPGESIDDAGAIVVRLTPDDGAAFRPWDASTAAVLSAITAEDVAGRRVLDLGTGTGALAIVAALRGAATVVACEWLPEIAELAARNCEASGVEVEILPADPGGRFDVILANLGGEADLIELARRCDLLIATGRTTRELVSGGRGERPVYRPTVADVAKAIGRLGRTASSSEFAAGWGIVKG